MISDELGDRIKRYEAASNCLLTHRMPVVIRVDGRAFHTFTKGLEKPYSQVLMDIMKSAAIATSKEMQGFKLAYVQSDEATFVITDTDTYDSYPWFGYEINKLVSITASAFTAYFNRLWDCRMMVSRPIGYNTTAPAMFDARAFNVPADDLGNVIVWRQRDWERNSVQMMARSIFSQKELDSKNIDEVKDMIFNRSECAWDDMPPIVKFGTLIDKDGCVSHERETYESVQSKI